jgi:hypothetical protein
VSASVGQIRKAIQTALEQIDGLSAYATWPGNVVPPAAMVRPMTIEYAEAFDSLTVFTFEIVVLVRYANLRAGQDALDEYVSPFGARSIQQAVENDQSLGGLTDIVNCARMHDYGEIALGKTPYLGAMFDVIIHAV